MGILTYPLNQKKTFFIIAIIVCIIAVSLIAGCTHGNPIVDKNGVKCGLESSPCCERCAGLNYSYLQYKNYPAGIGHAKVDECYCYNNGTIRLW